MIAKAFLIACFQAVLIQSIYAVCNNCNPCLAPASSCGCSNSNSGTYYGFSTSTTASTGGPLSVTCYGPLASTGVSVLAELGMEGQVEVCGSLPFLSAVTLEGTLPTSGSAAVNYGCGDGNVIIVQENGNPNGNNAASNSGLCLGNLARCCRN